MDCNRHQKNDNAETVIHRLLRAQAYAAWPASGLYASLKEIFFVRLCCVLQEMTSPVFAAEKYKLA